VSVEPVEKSQTLWTLRIWENAVLKVKYDDLLFAYEFANSSFDPDTGAYISLETGAVHCKADGIEEEELPPDLYNRDRYLPLPNKNDLDLGPRLAYRFTRVELPHCYEQVREIFRHEGAYHRFKQLLDSERALEKWFAFEERAVENALREWCVENGIDVKETMR